MSIKFIITFQAKEDAIRDLSEVMRQVKTDLPNIEGCEGVQVLRNAVNPSVFTLVEAWESKNRHLENSQKLADSGAWDQIVDLLVSAPAGNYYDEI